MIFQLLRRWFARQDKVEVRLLTAVLVALLLNLVFGLAFFYAERGTNPDLTILDSIWWAMVSMTTVGYGDYYPETFIGRFIVGYPTFLLGIGIIGYLLGLIAESVIQRIAIKRQGLMDLKLKDHIVICHCPSKEKVLQLVREYKHDMQSSGLKTSFVVVTRDLEENPPEFEEEGVLLIKGNPADENVLMRANIRDCNSVLILAKEPANPESDSQSFTVTTIIEQISREIGKDIRTVVELVERSKLKTFERTNADGIVFLDGVTDHLLIQELFHPGVRAIVEELITARQGSQIFLAPNPFEGVRMRDLQIAVLEHETNMQILGLIQNGKASLTPDRTITLDKGAQLILLGTDRREFEKIRNDLARRLNPTSSSSTSTQSSS